MELLIAIVLMAIIFELPVLKGLVGNCLFKGYLKTLSRDKYQCLEDLEIGVDGKNGLIIEHIVISIYGIFVISRLDKNGWLFVNKDSSSWSQITYEGEKDFENPFIKNDAIIKYISKSCNLSTDYFNSLVVTGYKTTIRENNSNLLILQPFGMIRFISKKKARVIKEEKVTWIRDHILDLSLGHS